MGWLLVPHSHRALGACLGWRSKARLPKDSRLGAETRAGLRSCSYWGQGQEESVELSHSLTRSSGGLSRSTYYVPDPVTGTEQRQR